MSSIQGGLVELRVDPKGFCAPQLPTVVWVSNVRHSRPVCHRLISTTFALLLKLRLWRSRSAIHASLKRSSTTWNVNLEFQVSNVNNDDIIFNYSHRVLTETEKSVLARGLRFCLPPKDVDRYEVKCSFELLYRDLAKLELPLTNENHDRLKSQLKNISYSYIYSHNSGV